MHARHHAGIEACSTRPRRLSPARTRPSRMMMLFDFLRTSSPPKSRTYPHQIAAKTTRQQEHISPPPFTSTVEKTLKHTACSYRHDSWNIVKTNIQVSVGTSTAGTTCTAGITNTTVLDLVTKWILHCLHVNPSSILVGSRSTSSSSSSVYRPPRRHPCKTSATTFAFVRGL